MKQILHRVCIKIALSPMVLLTFSKTNNEYLKNVYIAFKEELSKTVFYTKLGGVYIPIKFKFVNETDYFKNKS